MVCPRCVYVVKQTLEDLNIKFEKVDLGYAVLPADQLLNLDQLNDRLDELGIGLVRDPDEAHKSEEESEFQRAKEQAAT